ncbi:hypothetical protein B0F90DRAFT_1813953 [Multifurca ochricompacta]|uniref:Uncharacterized protein n=1 Tax=Multifurca ochricompacta TaxID=376703 RepID=A0AAD4QSX7_9AGAM|nr:hypothetical protein B0F90DRAFT_1813953 [Multifurca ochricompacta]
MHRIASVLGARRSDKSHSDDVRTDSTSKSSPCSQSHRRSSRRFFGTLTRITVSTVRPTQPLEPTHSSSASSSGSASLRTPEDDRVGSLAPHSARSTSSRKAWIPWLTLKKSDLQTQSQSRPPSSYWSDPLSFETSSTGIPAPSRFTPSQPVESDEDSSDESSESESEAPSSSHPAPPRLDSNDRLLAPVHFLSALTANMISPPISPPPLLHYSHAPLFPRSSNASRSLTFRETFESTMHRKRLLHRLQGEPLTQTDRRFLAAIGPHVPSAAQRRTLFQPEEGERYDLRHVQSFSPGLKQWIARPYFEDRMVTWTLNDAGTVVWTTVKGSGFGVWALDVSETLELLSRLDSAEDTLPIGAPVAPSLNNSPLASTSLHTVGKHVPYKAVPSPLRYDRGPSEPPTLSSTSELMTPASADVVSSSRRGVRFAENVDKEDQVPLGYILRHRKRREEKALFLQREQERRRHDEDRSRHEAERQQWEHEKRQWQKERRAMEDAKRQKQYTEEIAAARVRRESLYVLPSSQAREQDRRTREAYSRLAYDPRRQNEHTYQAHPLRSRNGSSSSSRQGSLPRSESGGPHASRPASTHSVSSSEDVRTRISRNSRRGSLISESSQRSVTSPVFAYGRPPVPPLPQVPPIPVFSPMQPIPVLPHFAMDYPLLPPSAPFMLQQYHRPRSQDSTPSRGTGNSHSSDQPQRSTDRASPTPRHHRSSSDDYGGRNSPAHLHNQRNNSLPPPRLAQSTRANSSDAPPRVSTSSSMHKKPYAARRQTAFP